LILDVYELEILLDYVSDRKVLFVDCLKERARLGSRMFLSFHDFFRTYRSERDIPRVRNSLAVSQYRAIMDRVCHRFFKRPYTELSQSGYGSPQTATTA
jgi:hypothetical protein